MITEHDYRNLDQSQWEPKIKDCCDKGGGSDTPPDGCDCCYDTWQSELKQVNAKFSHTDEEARQASNQLGYITARRDKLKTWYDELTKANDLSRQICHQLEIMLSQIGKISSNTKLAAKALKVLYCMVRDFYMQVDLIKTKYDQLMNCIKCLNDPVLAPGQGIMKCLEDYGKKLDALIATRDVLVKMLMDAIYAAYRINKNIAKYYGLYTVIHEWVVAFNCDESCGDDEGQQSQQHEKFKEKEGHDHYHGHHDCKEEVCKLEPMLSFPICNDPYYHEIWKKYDSDKNKAEKLAKDATRTQQEKRIADGMQAEPGGGH